MRTFDEFYQRALIRSGDEQALQSLLPQVLDNHQLSAIGDDRFLAMMTKAINQAGFNWSVIEKKWPEFEEAFFGFDVLRLSLLPDHQWEEYLQDRRVVRNWQKIKAVMENVGFIEQVAQEYGSFGHFMAEWPADDQIGLMAYLKKHGSRLGGLTSQWFMRHIGKDGFILTPSVAAGLNDAGAGIAVNPTSQKDLKTAQTMFNTWQQESGLPYAHISKIVACSLDV